MRNRKLDCPALAMMEVMEHARELLRTGVIQVRTSKP